MGSCNHKERRTPKPFPNGHPIGPHYVMKEPKPLCRITIGCFVQHLANIPMRSFYLPIRLGIVRGNSNPFNSIFLLQPSNCRSIRPTIIGNNFRNATPSTDDVLKEPISYGLAVFISDCSAFHPRCHSTP